MAQNHGSRARPWANVPLPNGPWAPLVAIAAVLATVALVTNGPRIGDDAPTVPDGRPYATADAASGGGLGRAAPGDPDDVPPLADPEPTAVPPSAPRSRRRAPATSHRRRRSAPSRPRTRAPRGRRPAPPPTAAVPAIPRPSTPRNPVPATPRRPSNPHRAPISSADREFGP